MTESFWFHKAQEEYWDSLHNQMLAYGFHQVEFSWGAIAFKTPKRLLYGNQACYKLGW